MVDLAPQGTKPREIDAILVSKFDTVDEKVGAAISMTYATGKPIIFVGTGQKYPNLKKLNIKSLKLHMKKHTEEATHECSLCNKKFLIQAQLKRHIKISHEKQMPFKCEICGKGFTGNTQKEDHLAVHKGIKLYTCDLCGVSLTQKVHLKRHIECVHEGKKQPKMKRQDLMCGKCGKLCFNRQGLKLHEETHNANRTLHTCDVCSKTFTNVQNMQRHIKLVHKGLKPLDFTCEICQKGFSSSTAVNEHMTMHTGEKPHKCEQCDKCFTQRSSLCAHRKRCHTKMLFKPDLNLG